MDAARIIASLDFVIHVKFSALNFNCSALDLGDELGIVLSWSYQMAGKVKTRQLKGIDTGKTTHHKAANSWKLPQMRRLIIMIIIIISAFVWRLYYYPVRKWSQSFRSTICNWPSACPICTKIVIFPTTDRYQMRSGQRSKLRLNILPRDTNTLAVAGLELTTLIIT